jgi:uncharacterized protein YegP (UPF0339 family)
MPPENPMRFRFVPSAGGQWRVHFEDAKNGKLVLWSQPYDDVRDAAYAVVLARRYAATAPWADRRQAA